MVYCLQQILLSVRNKSNLNILLSSQITIQSLNKIQYLELQVNLISLLMTTYPTYIQHKFYFEHFAYHSTQPIFLSYFAVYEIFLCKLLNLIFIMSLNETTQIIFPFYRGGNWDSGYIICSKTQWQYEVKLERQIHCIPTPTLTTAGNHFKTIIGNQKRF